MFIGVFRGGPVGFVAMVVACVAMPCTPSAADSLEAALAYAYQNNPQLNAQRALVAPPTKMCRRPWPATGRKFR